jgi:ATP-dependent helicase HrpB
VDIKPLSIDALIPDVIAALRQARSVTLVAPPGAGKTTRVPPAVLDSGLLSVTHPLVVVLQPRRVAARATAARIAQERGVPLGDEVGYQIRMERKTSARTRLTVVTEGILTRQLLSDPFLEGVGAVILDEFHERSLHTDFALALLREVRQTVREDLLLVVMSATMDAEPVAQFLGHCPIVRAEGRQYPIDISYHPSPHGTPLPQRAATAVDRVLADPEADGDVLVFLPGADEIRRTARAIESHTARTDVLVLPLHGRLSSEEQDRALGPCDRRKVVLATNVAETSLTIEGIRTVIDTGFARYASYDSARGLERLELGRISRASADQRAGRAGRTAPGRCLRLWSEAEHRGLPVSDIPEIHRVDLSSTVLALHAWGSADPVRFGWFESPPDDSLRAAERLLEALGALETHTKRITPLGRRLLDVPIHPRLARLLLSSAEAGCLDEGAAIAALLSERDLTRPGADGSPPISGRSLRAKSDLLVKLDLLREAERCRFASDLRHRGIEPTAARQAAQTRQELMRLGRRWSGVRRASSENTDEDVLLRLILLAYPDRVARRRGPGEMTARMVGGRGVRLESSSVVREAEYFVALDATEDRRSGTREARARTASTIERQWILDAFPEAIREVRELRFDEQRGRVVAVRSTHYRDLLLEESPHGAVDADEAARMLGDVLRNRALEWVHGDTEASAWLIRCECLRQWMPEADWTPWGTGELGEVIAEACAGLRSLDDVRKVSLLPRLRGRIRHDEARRIEQEAPAEIVVPSGNRITLSYELGRAPILAVRIQEIFGWNDTPRVAGGRVPVVLHLLGPNFRPVQITDDLRSFWTTTYYQVRKDLRARYPKHAWPEDPWTARAEAKGGRRH